MSRTPRGLIRRQKKPVEQSPLITLKEAAALLNLDESTVRKGKAGTKHLNKVRQGTGPRSRVYLVRAEVMAHLESLLEHARLHHEDAARVLWLN